MSLTFQINLQKITIQINRYHKSQSIHPSRLNVDRTVALVRAERSATSDLVSAWVSSGRVVKMTGVDEILNYQRNPDDDFYGLLGCDENSSVSTQIILIIYPINIQ